MIARAAFRVAMLLVLGASVLPAQRLPAPVFARQVGAATGGKPDLRPERIAGEVVAGTYAGVIGYFVGRGVGSVATSMMSPESDALRERVVNTVGITSAAFAIGGTVYGIGTMGDEAGSFRTTMVGVGAGVAASLLVTKLIFTQRMSADEGSSKRKWLMATLESSLPAIGGTIAFNSSRRWQR